MISAWWLLLLIPVLAFGDFYGHLKTRFLMRSMALSAVKLIRVGNTDRAIRVLNVAATVQTKKQEGTFRSRLEKQEGTFQDHLHDADL